MCLGLCLTSWGGQSQLSVFTIPDWMDVRTAGITPSQKHLAELPGKKLLQEPHKDTHLSN